MKAILISIHPQWVELILNFIKKDEIRKGTAIGKAITRLIKEQGVAPMLIYCTKGGEILWRHNNLNTYGELSKDVEKQFCAYGKNRKELDDKLLDFLYKNGIRVGISRGVHATLLNGKVVARFNATAEEIICRPICGEWECYTKTQGYSEIAKASCLKNKEIVHYLKGKNGTAIHINDLEIFDKPKELNRFGTLTNKCNGFRGGLKPLTKAPQSWCYVEAD